VKTIGIIGGGLAGLVSAIILKKEGLEVTLYEEKKYPFHRVCGEYISNEVVPFLQQNDLYPDELYPLPISNFHLTSPKGKSLKMTLDLGGFGISRHSLDQWLFEKSKKLGVSVVNDRVVSVKYDTDEFQAETRRGDSCQFDIVIGAFGKRSNLDKSLQRGFIQRNYPYVGVKYHIETREVANDVVELHNFNNGYCGVSGVENNKFNLCYLTHRSNLKNTGSIEKMENEILKKNPHLNRIFSNSNFLFEKPEVINEISFESKEPVFQHVLMTGDSAGMITPLCGNGMAMAIHSAKILSELIIQDIKLGFDRERLEENYANAWKQIFERRLWAGRKIQQLFGAPILSELAVATGQAFKPFASYLMSKTHGMPF